MSKTVKLKSLEGLSQNIQMVNSSSHVMSSLQMPSQPPLPQENTKILIQIQNCTKE